jgi:hypothetical protein
MPLHPDDLHDAQKRLMVMLLDSVETLRLISKSSELMFEHRGPAVRAAIEEWFQDFLLNPQAAGEVHPEVRIFQTTREALQSAGFYGAQLDLKEDQLKSANAALRDALPGERISVWRRPFKRWIGVLNNFLGSLGSVGGVGEALKELKDCLKEELPDE